LRLFFCIGCRWRLGICFSVMGGLDPAIHENTAALAVSYELTEV
jgi:hypothetical protein